MALRNASQVLSHMSTILELAKPRLVNGVWHKADISARKLAEIRKFVLMDGHEWPLDAEEAKRRVERKVRPIKGRKADLQKPARLEKIAKAMEKMPELVAKHKKTVRELRQSKKQEAMEKRA
eukprot:TRINITY_DN675_c0_g1_i1.p2 TRINITY_DN675_c0_g1~~TRINITY_DN675_c0_g1_i1.p2  ORF type:complete len:122 (-),score=34.86 TRINITY_DN675_c0_g1_i1:69-434(-)